MKQWEKFTLHCTLYLSDNHLVVKVSTALHMQQTFIAANINKLKLSRIFEAAAKILETTQTWPL